MSDPPQQYFDTCISATTVPTTVLAKQTRLELFAKNCTSDLQNILLCMKVKAVCMRALSDWGQGKGGRVCANIVCIDKNIKQIKR